MKAVGTGARPSGARWQRAAWVGLALLAHGAAQADWDIPAQAVAVAQGGVTSLGCTDLYVGGTLTVGAGSSITEVRSVFIQPGGRLELTGGTVQLAEQWDNQGNVTAAGGQVVRVNSATCPAQGALGPIAGGGPPTPVPTLGSAALAALAALMAALAWRRRRPAGRTTHTS